MKTDWPVNTESPSSTYWCAVMVIRAPRTQPSPITSARSGRLGSPTPYPAASVACLPTRTSRPTWIDATFSRVAGGKSMQLPSPKLPNRVRERGAGHHLAGAVDPPQGGVDRSVEQAMAAAHPVTLAAATEVRVR